MSAATSGSSGMYLRTLSSSDSLPSRASSCTAAAVNCFETDPTSKIVSIVIGTSCSRSAIPYAARTTGCPLTSAPTAHPGVLVVHRENSLSTWGWGEVPGPWAAVRLPRNAALAMAIRLTQRRVRMMRILTSGGRDNAGDPAGVFFFRPIGRQHLQVHGRTEAGVVNLPFRHTSKNELIAVRGGDIQPQLRPFTRSSRRRRRREPAVDEIAFVTGGGERIHQVRSDLIAAGTDARTDRGNDVPRVRSELVLHRVHCRHRGTSCGAAPSGVHRGASSSH